jgi:hypothetical protein
MGVEARVDIVSDELMKRFLVGDVTPEERERVEDRFMTDPDSFERVSAIEDDLILSHVRNELPAEWRERFESAYLKVPARRRRVDEMRAVVAGMATQKAPVRTRKRLLVTLSAAAAVLVAIGIAALLQKRQPVSESIASSPPPIPSAVATFVLAPGASRAPGLTANQFRLPNGEATIDLATVPDAVPRSDQLTGEIRAVDGDVLAVPGRPVRRRRDGRDEVVWTIPARLLQPGDYVLTIGEDGPPTASPIARRFFRIVG